MSSKYTGHTVGCACVAADKIAMLQYIGPHIPENSISFHRDGIAELYRVNSQLDLDK